MVDVPVTVSEAMWQKLLKNAQIGVEKKQARAGAKLETVKRLKQLCDDILSGKAIVLADERKMDRLPFRGKRINEAAIAAYNRMRGWSGPHPVTIRSSEDYRSYVRAREEEAEKPRLQKPKNFAQREIEKAIDRIPLMDDRDLIRREVEIGRMRKAELDHALYFLTQLPGIDLGALDGLPSTKDILKSITVGIDESSRSLLRRMLGRLTDNDGFLRNFDLVFRSGRMKMDYGTGQDLIFPEEIAMLAKLAWFDLPIDKPDDDLI